MKRKQRKRPLTLLEIMIVIFLIGLIGSVVGYNVKGSLDEGRAFRSEQGAAQIRDLLLLEVAKGYSVDDVVGNYEAFLTSAGVVRDVKKLLKDGWGQSYVIEANSYKTDIKVRSDKLKAFQAKKKVKLGTSATVESESQVDEEDEE